MMLLIMILEDDFLANPEGTGGESVRLKKYFQSLRIQIEIRVLYILKSKFNSREIESIDLFYLEVLLLLIDVLLPPT